MSLRAGLAFAPYLTVAGLLLLCICNPIYNILTNMLPLSDVQPVLHRSLSICLVVFSVHFNLLSTSSILPFLFSVFLTAFAPFLMSTFWVRMAHLHTQREAQRVYGVVAAGAQLGELLSSVAAPPLHALLGENALLLTALLVELSVRLIER